MEISLFKNRVLQCMAGAHMIIVSVVLLTAAPGMATAKGGDREDNRSEFSGIVQSRPQDGLQGQWVIGGRTFVVDAGTEFDQSDGDLAVGACAEVGVRNGRVHEIDSEPLQDCR